jgi:NhaA family Na+:H+ antiporter
MKINISRYIVKPIERFAQMEASSGIVLAICTVLAMVAANSSLSSDYFALLKINVLGLSIQHWINDGLMAIFFFVIGMEIKKELVAGELSSPKKAALPMAAAIGGMVVPALFYFYFNQGTPYLSGWGIPMATDIAFALGVLTLFGKKVPLSLKIFLLALAIVDDLGAVIVIAVFYTDKINLLALASATLFYGVMIFSRQYRVRKYSVYVLIGIGVWISVLLSGVHATVAGVIIGLLTPYKFLKEENSELTYSPLEDLVHKLHPWVSFGIMPIFALANAGISLQGLDFFELVQNPVHQGVAIGLALGKPIGITLFSFVAVGLGIGQLPSDLRWSYILSVGFLAGIGFTMALFISSLALPESQEVFSKTGILVGSLISALLGAFLLSVSLKSANK